SSDLATIFSKTRRAIAMSDDRRAGESRNMSRESNLFMEPSPRYGYPFFLGSLSYGAPVPDEPRKSVWPLGRVRSRPLARSDPSFDWYPSTTTSMPICSESLVRPRRSSVFGVPASIIHSSVVPSGFFTSTWIHTWGLIHSIFVTAPRNLTGRFASNSALNAWWAMTGAISSSAPIPPATNDNRARIGLTSLEPVLAPSPHSSPGSARPAGDERCRSCLHDRRTRTSVRPDRSVSTE